jgi:hypothetical protein
MTVDNSTEEPEHTLVPYPKVEVALNLLPEKLLAAE